MFESRIQELRIERGINMKQAAQALNIPYTTYVGYEKGDREPDSTMLIRLADFYNSSIDYLLMRSNIRIDEEVLDKVNEIDNELLQQTGNIYEALLAEKKEELIKKYRTLDEYGKKAVDSILDIEYERCTTVANEQEESGIEIRHSYYKVSAGTGFDLDDDDNWEILSIPDTPEARKADFALTIKGDSMEPVYRDKDIVLVKEQPAVDIGEIGIFIINGTGYIKKYGGERLISLNAEYEDITFSENDSIRCAGKVIGRV